jgi:hypothetical protein
MKIGILTFCWTDHNYGQILQCYALQKYLCDAGHEAFVINYDKRNDYCRDTMLEKLKKASNPNRLIRYAREKFTTDAVNRNRLNSSRHFSQFKESYIKFSQRAYSSFYDLEQNPPEADIYIVGSDQVWNFLDSTLDKYENWINAYFLNFGNEKIKRMSYAASFGACKANINNKYASMIRNLLGNFCYISIREPEGIEICKSIGVFNVHIDPDPTLLLNANTYRNLYLENKVRDFCKSDKPYVLLYLVGNECNFNFKEFREWSSKKGLCIKYVADALRSDNYDKIYPTIPEWLWLIDNSSYVITNSFHGSVFSLIFKKKFLTVPLSGNSEGMNARIRTLFKLFSIKDRLLNGKDYEKIDEPYFTIPAFDKDKLAKIINYI